MKTCTLTQARANAATITKCIELAEQIRDERRVICDRLRATWKDHDRGSDNWEQNHNRIQALYDELSTSFEKALSIANSIMADMATVIIVSDVESEVIIDEVKSNAEILVSEYAAMVEAAMVDSLEAEKQGVSA